MTQEDHIREASLPVDQQEVDASTPLAEFDTLAAVTSVMVPKPQYVCADVDHLHNLLEIVKAVLPPDRTDTVFRCWTAYAAGYTGRKCLTCCITGLDFWYEVGRAMRRAHTAPGMVQR